VAQHVVEGRSTFGLLVCSTGIGMCMTANKVPGIRAALVVNEKMAALAREHNDANLLCLGANVISAEEAKRILDTFLEAHFEGGRHERRVKKMEAGAHSAALRLYSVDHEIA